MALDREHDELTPDQKVAEASLESFPASDPPAWIGGAATAEPARGADGMRIAAHEPGRARNAGQRGGFMGELIKDAADRWASVAGRRVGVFAEALRAAGDTFRDQGQHRLAKWSGMAATDVETMATYLEREDARAVLEDAEGLARRNPGAFIGLSLAAGLAVGRMLRASEPAWTADAEEVRA